MLVFRFCSVGWDRTALLWDAEEKSVLVSMGFPTRAKAGIFISRLMNNLTEAVIVEEEMTINREDCFNVKM